MLAALTPNGTFVAAFAVFFGCLIAGRVLSERALRTLAPEEKLRLIDAFAGLRAWSLVPIALIFLVFIGTLKLEGGARAWALPIVLLVVYLAGLNLVVWRKLRRLDLPAAYRRQFWLARVVIYVGLLIFLTWLSLAGRV